MNINDYFNTDSILFSDNQDKFAIIKNSIDCAQSCGYIKDSAEFTEAIIERESLMSTGIGLGIAIPHAKIQSITDFFIIVAVSKSDIAWESIDNQAVRLVFLIGGPAGHQKDYLQLLSSLVLLAKNEKKRAGVIAASSIDEIYTFLTS